MERPRSKSELAKGRVIRMRQAISYARLLITAIDDYDEELIELDDSLASKIINYDSLETPGKITALLQQIDDLRRTNQKIVVWSNFIETLNLIQRVCETKGWEAEVICGNTPTEDKYNQNIQTREVIIEKLSG